MSDAPRVDALADNAIGDGMTKAAEEIKEFNGKAPTEDFKESSVASSTLQQEVVTESVQAAMQKETDEQTVNKSMRTINVDEKRFESVIKKGSAELQPASNDSNFTELSFEATPASLVNDSNGVHARIPIKNLTEAAFLSGLGEFPTQSAGVTRSSNATLSSFITFQTNSESLQSTKKDETTLTKAVANNSTKKILAIRFDSKGDSIDLDGDESESKGNEISKEGKKKMLSERDNQIHYDDDDHDGETDPENEASNDRHDGSEHESDESDEIPIITISLGDILRRYMTILPPDNSRYEYDYEDSKETLIREFNEKHNVTAIPLASNSQEL